MRLKLTLALSLLTALLLSMPAAAGRRRAPAILRAVVAPPQVAALQKRGTKAATTTSSSRSIIVREINLDGLKKLLLRGGKHARPLLVNFWATWCEPCRDEFPDLVRINKDYKKRGLEFITVSLDEQSEIKTGVPEFLRDLRAEMPAYLLNVPDPEPAIKSVDESWGGGLPATFLFNAQGQIVFKHMGRVDALELRAAIEKAMGGK